MRHLGAVLASVLVLTEALAAAPVAASNLPGESPSPPAVSATSSPLPVEALRIGQRWRGRLGGDDAVAHLGFTLRAPQHLELLVVQPPDADVEVSLKSTGRELLRQRALEPGKELDLELWLEPGEHALTLRPARPSDGAYRLMLTRLDPFVVPADSEPNGDPALAREVPASLRWAGGPAGAEPDLDGFWLPPLSTPGEVSIEVTGERPLVRLFADAARAEPMALVDADEGLLVAPDAPTDRPLYLEVEAEGPYLLELDAPGWAPADDALAPPVELELELDDAAGPVCETDGVSLPGSLTIVNAGAQPVELELRTASSDPGWQVRLEQVMASLASGESLRVPVRLEVAAGNCPDSDVAISLAAVTPAGGLVSTTLTLDPSA